MKLRRNHGQWASKLNITEIETRVQTFPSKWYCERATSQSRHLKFIQILSLLSHPESVLVCYSSILVFVYLSKVLSVKNHFSTTRKWVAHTLYCRTSLVGYFYEDLSNFSRRIEGVLSTLFWALFGHADKSTFDTNKNAEITEITGHLLFATYSLASVLVAMNLLIAMLSNTFKKVSVSISNLWVLLKY